MKATGFYSQSWIKAGALSMALLGCLGGLTVNQVFAQTATQTTANDKLQEARAIFEQGVKYFTADKPSKADQAKAAELITQAANMGYDQAQNGLGTLLYLGLIVKQNDTEALAWFRKAAEQGHAEAQYNVGRMYTEGKGVEQSEQQAAVWYERSAEQGFAPAQSYLGVLYLFGIDGIEKNQDKAIELLQKAAKQGDQQAIQLMNKLQPTA